MHGAEFPRRRPPLPQPSHPPPLIYSTTTTTTTTHTQSGLHPILPRRQFRAGRVGRHPATPTFRPPPTTTHRRRRRLRARFGRSSLPLFPSAPQARQLPDYPRDKHFDNSLSLISLPRVPSEGFSPSHLIPLGLDNSALSHDRIFSLLFSFLLSLALSLSFSLSLSHRTTNDSQKKATT
ncbi:hypothetical protein BZA05DRAFT_39001 [Tricharina praecox]|uniref:uncharacterized protein n=1 Tax=Tricharina praecox TaxID=43433 RepID=UPI00222060B1|nr:uncharacterized protein BZA05DRAFT_39001 [Tricharina praecox]KAI5852215.1 hypothetical protein BZA05DRAFT_39001 [Tricharina praecox]